MLVKFLTVLFSLWYTTVVPSSILRHVFITKPADMRALYWSYPISLCVCYLLSRIGLAFRSKSVNGVWLRNQKPGARGNIFWVHLLFCANLVSEECYLNLGHTHETL